MQTIITATSEKHENFSFRYQISNKDANNI